MTRHIYVATQIELLDGAHVTRSNQKSNVLGCQRTGNMGQLVTAEARQERATSRCLLTVHQASVGLPATKSVSLLLFLWGSDPGGI